jgi:beta-lactam-binding protein with PASTA domain
MPALVWSRKPPGRVLFQRPATGAALHAGDRVTIIVARAMPPGIP